MAGLFDFISGGLETVLGGGAGGGVLSGGISSGKSSTSGSSSTTTTQKRGNDLSQQITDKLTQLLSDSVAKGADPNFSKDQAIKDTQAQVDQIFRQYSTDALPNILAGMGASGGYAATGAQLLANDAFSTAVAKGSALVTDTISKYTQLANDKQGQTLSALLTALGLEQSANTTQTENSQFNTSTKSSSKSLGLKFSL